MRFVKILGISSDRIVAQMNELVADLLSVIICSWKSYIAFFIQPYCQRIKTGSDHPLSDIKFTSFDNQWIFYIFLSNPLGLLCFHMVLNLYQVVVSRYTSASWKPCGFEDPNVIMTCKMILRELLLIYLESLLHLLK